ncbi:uncharacterized protein GIQ15_03465 [Arthroderma uncinatum]|uniref:uncharacterized protein n=1 Tax=Arthroderma uncinatum TaxID=74035 RepID=UPI00144A6083|nr:uncharacterized protein GIQ15_03465 [Arthroderma uncinatum]KAF3484141.1 hypothetical protein GIQ15_03465 [Arthroderma uncinatum]
MAMDGDEEDEAVVWIGGGKKNGNSPGKRLAEPQEEPHKSLVLNINTITYSTLSVGRQPAVGRQQPAVGSQQSIVVQYVAFGSRIAVISANEKGEKGEQKPDEARGETHEEQDRPPPSLLWPSSTLLLALTAAAGVSARWSLPQAWWSR